MRCWAWACLGLLACTPQPDPPPLHDMLLPDMPIPAASFAGLRTDPLLLSVWSDGAQYWITGGSGGGDGIVLHGRETMRFMVVPSGPALWWLWGTGTHRWAVGEGGRILRYDGQRWRGEASDLPDTAVLWGIWGSGPNDLWAVGGSQRPGGPKGVVLRSTGDGVWRRIEDATLPTETNLFKVWGSSADDVHFVGEGGVALHWNGTRFRRVETGGSALLFTVHGQPGGSILAVGGVINGVALRWNGERWVDDAPPAGLPPFNGVFVRPDGKIGRAHV